MRTPTPQRNSQDWWPRSANDRFKARSQERLYWATIVAVAVHAVLFLWFPHWGQPEPLFQSSTRPAQMELVAIAGSPALSSAMPVVTVSETEDASTAPDEPGSEDGADGSEEGTDGPSDGVRAELLRRASPAPTIVEPEPEREFEERSAEREVASAEEEGEGTRIDAHSSLHDHERLSRDEALYLERLSALRPELAFMSPSSWILLRNPSEVGEFMERRFRPPQVEPGASGAVSVALWIDEEGSVEWAEINRSSGRRHIDETALELFQDVVSFRPAREGGVRVPTAVIFWLSYPW